MRSLRWIAETFRKLQNNKQPDYANKYLKTLKENAVETISVKEFTELGYLQELNRNFLHPLGLALAVSMNEDGDMILGPVIDVRDDPEGMRFDITQGKDEKEFAWKAAYIAKEWETRSAPRLKELGYVIQPTRLLAHNGFILQKTMNDIRDIIIKVTNKYAETGQHIDCFVFNLLNGIENFAQYFSKAFVTEEKPKDEAIDEAKDAFSKEIPCCDGGHGSFPQNSQMGAGSPRDRSTI